MRTDARVVIIGGGVAGCSIAYHLARLGWTDVLLVEQHELTEGTTWHSAGFVGQLRSTISQTRMIMYSSGLYAELADQTGLDPGWRGVGGMRLATTPSRVEELLRQASSATTYGLDLELLSPAALASRLPMLDVSDVRLAGWLPGDGYLRPDALAGALAAGARALGVTFATGTSVTGIEVVDGRVRAVQTPRGRIATEIVVNAAGAAAGHVGASRRGRDAGRADQASVRGELAAADRRRARPCRRSATRTTSSTSAAPTTGTPDGLLIGGYIRTPSVCWPAAGPPLAAPRALFPPELDLFAESWAAGRHRVPALRSASIARVVNGAGGVHPGRRVPARRDGGPRFLGGGGLLRARPGRGRRRGQGDGRVDRRRPARIRRVPYGHSPVRRARGEPLLGDREGARRLLPLLRRRLPAHRVDGRPAVAPLGDLAPHALDASLGEKAGWERVNWFAARPRRTLHAARPGGWAGHNWSPAIAAECRATASAAGLFDQSSFAKLDVRGAGARAVPAMDVRQRRRPPGPAGSSTPSCSTTAPASRPT